MKTAKTKYNFRKGKTRLAMSPQDAAECWALDHDHPDPDLQLYRIERSPRQENL